LRCHAFKRKGCLCWLERMFMSKKKSDNSSSSCCSQVGPVHIYIVLHVSVYIGFTLQTKRVFVSLTLNPSPGDAHMRGLTRKWHNWYSTALFLYNLSYVYLHLSIYLSIDIYEIYLSDYLSIYLYRSIYLNIYVNKLYAPRRSQLEPSFL